MMRRPHALLLLLGLLAPGCCFNCAYDGGLLEPSCGLAALGFVEPGCGIARVFEPGCGIAGVLEPGCGIAGSYEPSCGIDGACACGEPSCGIDGVCCGACGEPSCGIAAACGEPSCGIAGPMSYAMEPSCGIAGPCGPFGGFGLFGHLWTGWGVDWQARACGWRQCNGPLMQLSNALRCGGCGDCYYDEWWCDPPRCCDPCPEMYGPGSDCSCGSCQDVAYRRWPKPPSECDACPTPAHAQNCGCRTCVAQAQRQIQARKAAAAVAQKRTRRQVQAAGYSR